MLRRLRNPHSVKLKKAAGTFAAFLLLFVLTFGSTAWIIPETAVMAGEQEENVSEEKQSGAIPDGQNNDEDSSSDLKVINGQIHETRSHTVMVYMIGSNLESRMGSATADLEEMKGAEVNYSDVNVLVCTGGSRRWLGDVPCDRNCVLDLSLDPDRCIVAETEGNVNMGEPDTLSDFVNFCTEHYPAEHNSLIFWDHGGGPLIGYGSDELFGSDGLLLSELKTAMQDTEFSQEKKLDLVGFDACLMGSIENMLLWSEYADFYVASEELEPGPGWDYAFLKELERTEDPKLIGKAVVDRYSSFYESARTELYDPDITLACVDLNRVGTLADSVNELASSMVKDYKKGAYSAVMQRRAQTKNLGLTENIQGYVSYYYDLADLGDLAAKLDDLYPETAESVRDELQEAIVYSYSNIERISGVSIYFPYRNKSQYSRMKGAYKSLSVSANYSRFLDLSNTYWTKSKFRDWNLGMLTDNGNEYTLALSEEQLSNCTGACFTILQESSFGGYVPVMTKCRMLPDRKGVLHLPKNIPLIALRTDGGELEVCPVTEVESGEDRVIFRTENTALRSDLTYSEHIEDLETQSLSVTVGLDLESGELSIRSFNENSFEGETGGKSTIDISRWESISFTRTASYTTRDETGIILPFREWNQTDSVTWTDLPIDEYFGFEQVDSSDTGLHLKCQIEIEDLNGECYASELADLPAAETIREETMDTDRGAITFAVYPDHAEAVEYTGRDKELILPETVNGVPLTKIRSYAFGKLQLYSAYGTYPFVTIVLPDTVKEIGAGAFLACRSLTEIQLPEGLESIGSQAFGYCSSLSKIQLPEPLRHIGKGAFVYCSSLTEVTIPSAVDSIGEGVFFGCRSLEAIELSADNTRYEVKDGALYTKDGSRLLAWPAAMGTRLSVAEGTEEIAYGACSSSVLEELTLPESLLKIGNYAFYASAGLGSFDFPANLTEIGMHAFDTYSWGLGKERALGNVQKLSIGKDINYIGSHAFDLFPNKLFAVDEENSRFKAENGALMNGAGDTVQTLGINSRNQVLIPEGVIEFEFDMLDFLNNINTLSEDLVTHIYFPESVQRFPEKVNYYDIDDVIWHCPKGSAAEHFAEENSIPFSNEMSAAYLTAEIPAEAGVLTARVYQDYAAVIRYAGEDTVLSIPEEILGRPVKVIGDGERAISANGYYPGLGQESFDAPNLVKVILPEGVEELSPNALDGFSYLNRTSVELPSTLKRIGDSALTNCTGVVLPSGVERLGYRFINTLPENGFTLTPALQFIDPEAFASCFDMQEYTQEGVNEKYSVLNGMLFSADGKTLISYAPGADGSCVIPEGTETIGKNAFRQRTNLKSADIPSSIKKIEEGAFYGCVNLESVSFADARIHQIGKEAFRSCSNLTAMDFPVIERIEANAFYGCGKLQSIRFREGLKSIGESAFAQTMIGDPSLPKSVQTVGKEAFYNYRGEKPEEGIPEINIGKNLEELGERAFGSVNASSYSVDPENMIFGSVNGFLTDKGGNVLLSCPSGMTGEAYIPEGISAIEEYAFAVSGEVSRLHIPDSVEYIGSVNFEKNKIEGTDSSADPVYGYGITVFCSRDSYAHHYALDRDIPFVLE